MTNRRRRLESEIEADIFEVYKTHPDTLSITRQLRLPGFGIPDLVIETYRGDDLPILTTVIEVKAGRAGMRVLRQLTSYLRGIRYYDEQQGIESVVAGCIAAPAFSTELRNYESEAELRGELFTLYRVPA